MMTLIWIAVGIVLLLTVMVITAGVVYLGKNRAPRPTPTPTAPSSTPPAPRTTPTTSTTIIWWRKERLHVISAVLAYILFWIVLYWYFPGDLSKPAMDKMLWFGGFLILLIIGLASPKTSALLACALLLIILPIGIINRVEKKGYVPESPIVTTTTKALVREAKKPTPKLRTVTVCRGESKIIQVPTNVRRITKVSPEEATVQITFPNGKVVKDYGYKDVHFYTPRTSGVWQEWEVTTDEDYPVTYTVSW